MSSSLNLTIEETINSLNSNINTLTQTLSHMDVDSKVAELSLLLPSLKNKVDEILKMYNDVADLQNKVNVVKNN
jgi:uncharacterized protein YhaN